MLGCAGFLPSTVLMILVTNKFEQNWEFNDAFNEVSMIKLDYYDYAQRTVSRAHFRRVVYVLPLSTAVAIACISTKCLKLSKLNTPKAGVFRFI